MVEPGNTNLSIGKQSKLLSTSGSPFYCTSKGETVMNLMGFISIYQKSNTHCPAANACMCERGVKHKTYPYLLRVLRVERPNQVWYADITYLPMRWGFLYLVAIMDWRTRKVLG